MKRFSFSLLLAVVGIASLTLSLSSSAKAADVYTDQPSFLAHVQAGYYLETFDSLPATDLGTSLSFSGNGFSYDASAALDLYGVAVGIGDNALSTNNFTDTLTLTFTSGNVTAVGGEFFNTDLPGNPSFDAVIVSLNDGTSVIVTGDINDPMPFRGFVSANALITSLTVVGPQFADHFPTIQGLAVE